MTNNCKHAELKGGPLRGCWGGRGVIKNKRVVGAPGATPVNYCHGIKAEVTPVSVPLCLLEHSQSFFYFFFFSCLQLSRNLLLCLWDGRGRGDCSLSEHLQVIHFPS